MMPETAAAIMGHILPRENATPLEIGLDLALESRVLDIPVPIRDLWRWDTCPASHLPWLAWSMSVDLWDDAWPETKKRAVIREAFHVHARKGTLYAIQKYLGYIDAPLLRAIVPPDKAFAGRTMTPEERTGWLARFPQIRIFAFRDRGEATLGAFSSSGLGLAKLFPGDQTGKASFFPYQTDARDRIGRRAFLWDKGSHPLATGEETALRWLERTRERTESEAFDAEQIIIPGSNVQALFPGDARGNLDKRAGRLFAVESTARTRVVTISVGRRQVTEAEALAQKTVAPSLRPVQAFPERVAERGMSRRGVQMFCGSRERWLDPVTRERKVIKGFLVGFVPETDSVNRIFDRLHLHDPARMPERRPPAIYAGHSRLGMPAFHAELTVAIRGRRSAHHFGRFVHGHFKPADTKALDATRSAIDLSKAYRDKVLLRTRIHRPITSRDRIQSGSGYRSGSLTANLT
jgi:hypothetical protein